MVLLVISAIVSGLLLAAGSFSRRGKSATSLVRLVPRRGCEDPLTPARHILSGRSPALLARRSRIDADRRLQSEPDTVESGRRSASHVPIPKVSPAPFVPTSRRAMNAGPLQRSHVDERVDRI